MRARNALERLRHPSSGKRIGVEIEDVTRRANYVRVFDFALKALVYSLLR